MKQLTQNIVKLALDLLLSTNGTTTTLDVKKHLRVLDYNAKQEEVHDFIEEIYEEFSNNYSRTLINNHYYEYGLIVPQNVVNAALTTNDNDLLTLDAIIKKSLFKFQNDDNLKYISFFYGECNFNFLELSDQLTDVTQKLSKYGLELGAYGISSFTVQKETKAVPATGSLMKIDSKSLLSNVQPKFELLEDKLDIVKAYPNKQDWIVYKKGEKMFIFDSSLSRDKARSRYVSILNVERKGVSVKRIENLF